MSENFEVQDAARQAAPTSSGASKQSRKWERPVLREADLPELTGQAHRGPADGGSSN